MASSGATSRIVEDLRRAIESGELKPGAKIAPIRELARRYGISFDAARAAVARAEKMHLLVRRWGSGTYVGDNIAPKHSASTAGAIAMMIDGREGHVYANLVGTLLEEFQQHDRTVVQYGWRTTETATWIEQVSRIVKRWQHAPPAALLLRWAPAELDAMLAAQLPEATVPIAVLRPPFPGPRWHSVNPDYRAIGRLAGEYAVSRGHQLIGYVTHQRQIGTDSASGRLSHMDSTHVTVGAGEALRKAGLRHALQIHHNKAPYRHGSDPLSEENIQQAVQWLQRPDRPTLVFGQDFRVVGIARAMERIGLAPGKDIEFLGIGNTPHAEALHFPSISLNEVVVARHAAELVLTDPKVLAGGSRHILIEPQLVLRT